MAPDATVGPAVAAPHPDAADAPLRVGSCAMYELPEPPGTQHTLAWLKRALRDTPVGDAALEGMAAAVEEEAVDGEALCGVVDQTELASVLGLSGSTDPGVADAVAALWAQVQLLQRVGRQGPWAFPTVMPRADAPPVFFVVLGDTGAGKSTMLNALLGECSLLPTNGMRACTAAIVELAYAHAPADPGRPYEGAVEFLSSEEWAAERSRLYASLRQRDGALVSAAPPEGTDAHVAYCKLRSVYGAVVEPGELEPLPRSAEEVGAWLAAALPAPLAAAAGAAATEAEIDAEALATMSEGELVAELGLPAGGAALAAVQDLQARLQAPLSAPAAAARNVAEALGGTVRVAHTSGHDLRLAVEAYVDSTNVTSSGALWPLVKSVKLRGPWEALAGGAVLVDAPGVQDDNSARDAVVKSYLRSAHAVWLVSNIRRAVNDKTVKDYLTSDLKQELVRNGRFGELAFVATQTDILEASEIADNLGLPPGTSKADCARARNAYTKRRVLADFYLGVETDGNPQAAAQADSCRQQQAAAAAEGGVAAPARVYGAGTYLCLPPGEPESSGGGHWGEWRALPCDTNPAVSVLRWTDDGAPVAATPCSLPPPAAEGDVAGRQGALAWQRPAAAFRLPVVTASAVDFQKLMGIRPDDGPPEAFVDVVDTEVLALRQLVHATVAVHRATLLKLRHTRTSLAAAADTGTDLPAAAEAPRPDQTLAALRKLPAAELVERRRALEGMMAEAESRRAGALLLQFYDARLEALDREGDSDDEEEEAEVGGASSSETASAEVVETDAGDGWVPLGPLSYVLPQPRWSCSHKSHFKVASHNAWTAICHALHSVPKTGALLPCLKMLSDGLDSVPFYVGAPPPDREDPRVGELKEALRNIAGLPDVSGQVRLRPTSTGPGYYNLTTGRQPCNMLNTGGEVLCRDCRAPRPAAAPAAFQHRLDHPQEHHDDALQLAVEIFRFLQYKPLWQVSMSIVKTHLMSKGVAIHKWKSLIKQLVRIFEQNYMSSSCDMTAARFCATAMPLVMGATAQAQPSSADPGAASPPSRDSMSGDSPPPQAAGNKRGYQSVGTYYGPGGKQRGRAAAVSPPVAAPSTGAGADFFIDSDGAIVID